MNKNGLEIEIGEMSSQIECNISLVFLLHIKSVRLHMAVSREQHLYSNNATILTPQAVKNYMSRSHKNIITKGNCRPTIINFKYR